MRLRQLPVEMLTPADAMPIHWLELSPFAILPWKHSSASYMTTTSTSWPQAGRIRIAIHGYNSETDIEHFLTVLTGALRHVAAA